MDTFVRLGGFVFEPESFSIPEKINGGGSQKLVKHEFIGGARYFVAMGPDDDIIRFSGRFRGSDAPLNVATLDAMRRAGQALEFTFWTYSYLAIIRKFTWSFERFYEMPYDLEIEVIYASAANGGRVFSGTSDSLFSSGLALASRIGLPVGSITSAISAVQSAASSLGSLQGLTLSSLGPLTSALASAQSVASRLIPGAAGGILGGVSVGLDPATMVSSLASNATAFLHSAAGVQVSGVLTRTLSNLVKR